MKTNIFSAQNNERGVMSYNMRIKTSWILACIILLSACEPKTTIEIGYQPPLIPVRVSVNSEGEVSASASYEWVTPIGVFDISAGTSINSIRNKYSNNVLVVRVDDNATVYELREGAQFDISFDDSNTLYKKVAFQKESNGDFILELESARGDTQTNNSSDNTTSYWCDDLDGVHLQLGDDARVVYPKVNLRSSPEVPQTWDANIVAQLDEGVDVTIIGGPECAHEGTWWEVRTEFGETGWMREFISDGYLLK